MSPPPLQLKYLPRAPKFGLRGLGAAEWIREQGLVVPTELFQVQPSEDSGRLARLGDAEYFIELVAGSELAARLEMAFELLPSGVYCIPRSEMTLVLSGFESEMVFAQTCGIDFRRMRANQVVFTRIAGVSCAVHRMSEGEHEYRMWVDYSYWPYLWSTLVAIVADLGGVVHPSALPAASAVETH